VRVCNGGNVVESPTARPRERSQGAVLVWVMLAALLATFLVPAHAQASQAFLSGGVKTPLTVSYHAAAGEANRVLILRAPDAIRVIDSGATIFAGGGCTSVSPNEVSCEKAARVAVVAGDLGDSVAIGGLLPTFVDGGDGNDTLEGGDGPDFLSGGPGADVLKGGVAFEAFGPFGLDVLEGGEGDDDLDPAGDGNYVLRGGPGADTFHAGERAIYTFVDYSDYTVPVVASADGLPNDGAAGEGDNLLTAEFRVGGGSGGDTVTGFRIAEGNGGDDDLTGDFVEGGAGDDTLRALGTFVVSLAGGPGNDTILGGRSFDGISGGPGKDLVRGGPGRDFIDGGRGKDLLHGGPGPDTLAGGPDSDVIQGWTGRDRLFGGRGRDLVRGGRGNDSFFLRDGRRDTANGGGGSDRARIDNGLDRVRLIERLF
jgi:Ca2+-binding RTX toxin-like protein